MRIHIVQSGLLALALAGGAPLRGFARQLDGKAVAVLAATHKAIGEKTLASLKTFRAEAKVQRTVGSMQINSDVELVLALPDRYARTDVSGSPMNMERTTGFNGERSLQGASSPAMAGSGGMMIRMGPGGPMPGEKPAPDQQEQMNKAALRASRTEVSRLMLGWFGMAHPSISAKYTYAGQADSPDGKADVIDVKGADGFAARLFIDQRTHLPLVVTAQGSQPRVVMRGPGDAESGMDQAMPPPTMVEYKLFFSEWTVIDGVRFPHKIHRSVGGATDEEWTVTSVKVNPKVDPKKFQVKS